MTQQVVATEQKTSALESDRNKLASSVQEAEGKRTEIERELARLTQTMAERNSQLAALEGRLQSPARTL